MSRKAIENYIPRAMEVLTEAFPDGTFPSSYNGYISSFGASILQSGLKSTLALFENKDANTKEQKEILTKIILSILDKDSQAQSLLQYVLASNEDEYHLKQKIIDISVAVKLTLRTFKKGD